MRIQLADRHFGSDDKYPRLGKQKQCFKLQRISPIALRTAILV